MILSCNSCDKKFVVPDNAITKTGRLVQCSACGNKWKQFPIKIKKKESITPQADINQAASKRISQRKAISPKKKLAPKRKIVKKTREINLYSPEYLAKKHGIKINNSEPKYSKKSSTNGKVSFGFYSSLLLFLVFVIFFSRSLYFFQNYIIALWKPSL